MNTTTKTQTPGQLVRSYRERIALDPDLFDGDLDVIMWLVTDTPERSWTPSEIAQVAKVSTDEARRLLEELTEDDSVLANRRGAWTRYYSRRAR